MLRSLLAVALVSSLAGSALAQCCDTKDASKDGAKTACTDDKSACGMTAKTVADKGSAKATCDDSKATCDGAKAVASASCGDKSDCESVLAKAGLKVPAMSYRVGEKTTACPMEAKTLAGEKGKFQFVVADKDYAEESEARKAYAKQLDGFLNEVMTVRYAVGEECTACPITAESLAKKEGAKVMYRVAAFDFETKEAAEKAVKAAREAAGNVKLAMLVGDKSYECPVSADDAAKVAGTTVQYSVGESATPCKVTAEVNLARARIDAAVSALVAAANG
jgi:hypothetical protein